MTQPPAESAAGAARRVAERARNAALALARGFRFGPARDADAGGGGRDGASTSGRGESNSADEAEVTGRRRGDGTGQRPGSRHRNRRSHRQRQERAVDWGRGWQSSDDNPRVFEPPSFLA